jgi:predicted restriction endonuclease
MRQSLVPIPPRAFSKIKLKDKVEEMLRKLQTILPPTPKALDLEVPSTERVESTIYRILRDTAMALKVKHLHNYKCQICGHTIELPGGGRYAEAHHIKPLGEKHNGPDVIGNILCVCPNHHAELDYGVSTITISALTCFKGHEIDPKYIDYHNQFVYKSILSS